MNDDSGRRGALACAIGIAGALAVILGAKLWLISSYGTSTPFWDQWAEPHQIYRPYFTGELSLGGLLAAHNEHRIFLARLVALALFIAEGRWDPVAQTLVNALIHVAAIGVLLVMLRRTLDLTGTLLLAALAALVFALPFGSGNTLVGFQSSFYLLVLLGPLSLWVLYASPAWSPRWWLGTLLGILSYFTIASGAMTLPSFSALALIQLASGRRKGLAEWLGVLVHCCVAAVIIHDIPQTVHELVLKLPGGEGLLPTTVAGWIEAESIAASWPVAKSSWPLIALIATAIGLYAPPMVLTGRLLRDRPAIRDRHWLLVALAAWSALQMLALLYGRGVWVLQSRYYDILLLGPLVSAAALLVAREARAGLWRSAVTLFACVWFAAVIVGVGQKAFDGIPGELAWWRQNLEVETRNLKEFLATGDFAALENKPAFEIPYPDAGFLRDTTTDPIIRAILPPDLLNKPEPENKLKGLALRQGRLLLPIGLALLMIAVLLATARREDESPD